MNFLLEPLNLVTFFPLLGVLVLLFIKAQHKNALRWTALVTSLATFGISLWMLGFFRLGRLVRYVPYPVIGGFLAGTGWLLVDAQDAPCVCRVRAHAYGKERANL